MAAYLPILLGSVANTSAISDDSSVTTQPRGQVDYLSHEWLEEDVWKSWRNMTKQKNEIANGARLENASWRTWWKQRNGLKTISPETLNWLKDSDVTWLYGPLHTAVEWTPPPQPKPDPTSVDDRAAASAHDRLNLSSPYIRHKPILKHRSISELLTSELPPSPLFSPAESEDEGDGKPAAATHLDTVPEAEEDEDVAGVRRPQLMYTKSDSHIAKWPDRAFRKDSPPRVEPPHHPIDNVNLHEQRPTHQLYSHNSDPSKQKKHISFNTFVEQCIAIDKPPEAGATTIDSGPSNDVVVGSDAWRRKAALNKGHWVQYDDGYDEEEEEENDDGESSPWDNTNESAIGSDESDEDDDGFIQMRGSSYHKPTTKPRSKTKRSESSVSTSSSSSSGSRPRRKSSSGNRLSPSFYRVNGRKPSLEEPKPPVHVTIAPIAPTILKVDKYPEDSVNGWVEGLGDDGDDDSGYKYYGKWSKNGLRDDSNVPVELVYVPPVGHQSDQYESDGGPVEPSTPRVGFDRPRSTVAQDEGAEEERVDDVDVREDNGPDDADARLVGARQVVPVVMRTSPTTESRELGEGELQEEDAYDYFAGPDMGSVEDFGARRRARGGREERKESGQEIEEVLRGRSRSRSRSRTPSPQLVSPSPKTDILIPRSSSGSSLLPPTVRGRPTSPTQPAPNRGRSSTRTSSSFSDRGSPIGSVGSCSSSSLSPDGVVCSGSTYANGRSGGRDRERGRDRAGKRLSSSMSPGSPDSAEGARASLDAVAASAIADKNASNTTITPSTAGEKHEHSEAESKANGIPSGITKSRPVVAQSGTSVPPSPTRTHGRTLSASLPSVSTSTTPPSRSTDDPPHSRSPISPASSSSPSSPHTSSHRKTASINSLQQNLEPEGTIVGRAIDAVSSAGAFLGLWHNNHTHNHHTTQGSQAH
ncbi:hypothetical protein BD626DRAFT_204935 [Schizophyllum amplum]|uniref:Nitrogen regulatory protein areA GATA-like domain-containing protein n=1 Tax=Schizophyllum amplum TaxID=97359 RepID=A0A550BZD0_9AGAR|nr:hypothetical protein BD626DRAFT_204935 [Auriculariopsis ampla]